MRINKDIIRKMKWRMLYQKKKANKRTKIMRRLTLRYVVEYAANYYLPWHISASQ